MPDAADNLRWFMAHAHYSVLRDGRFFVEVRAGRTVFRGEAPSFDTALANARSNPAGSAARRGDETRRETNG